MMFPKSHQLSLASMFVTVAVVMTLLSFAIDSVSSNPSIEGWTEYHRRFGITDPKRFAYTECENSSREVREVCQRCAKVTKSRLAYPMCCEDQDNARQWCRDLLMIG